jgi:hypothetical protein
MSNSQTNSVPTFQQTALALAARGLYVFPLLPRAKTPATESGFKDASTDPGLIAHWWSQNPNFNIGVATGERSHVFVVDVDGDDAESELRKLETENGPLPATIESITAKGRHIFFDWPSRPVCCSVGKLAPGIDIRGEAGYIVSPPSVHPCGRAYAWSVDCAKTFAPAPNWLLHRIGATNGRRGTPPEEWRTLAHHGVNEGERNNSIARLAGYMLRSHVDPVVAFELLISWNTARCRPPLDESEVATIVDSIARAELKRRGTRRNGRARHDY